MPTTPPRLAGPAGGRVQEALGRSEAFLDFQERLSRAARVDRPILIVGERGVGKELAAARLHYLSGRWKEPLVALNCAALATTLIETELFGHEAGAFTGAVRKRIGRFEAADGGALFLDEIGNIPLDVQEKILRVVEYGVFERVGASASVHVDVRLIGATHADLPAMAAQGRFKPDLLDRLSFEVLELPPLRRRRGDVMLLANHFAARMAHELGWDRVPEFHDQAVAALEGYPWPGNVRELKNVVERAVYRSTAYRIRDVVFDPFPPSGAETRTSAEPGIADPAVEPAADLDTPLPEQVRRLERLLVQKALEEVQYNQKRAAERLGLTYNQFRGLYRKYRLDRLQ